MKPRTASIDRLKQSVDGKAPLRTNSGGLTDEAVLRNAELYRSFCSSTMCYQICEKYKNKTLGKRNNLEPYSQKQYAFVLFADISGFTKLATTLSADELKVYINEFFSMLIGIIDTNNGDIIKFCGDALIIMWPFPPDVAEGGKQAGAVFASLCALQLLSECDSYVRVVPGSDTVVHLRLHCSISCGIVHCMCLGELKRWEFIVSGEPLQEVGAALNLAAPGMVCITEDVMALVQHVLQCVPMETEDSTASIYMLTGDLSEHAQLPPTPDKSPVDSLRLLHNDSLITSFCAMQSNISELSEEGVEAPVDPRSLLTAQSTASISSDQSSVMFRNLEDDSVFSLSNSESWSTAKKPKDKDKVYRTNTVETIREDSDNTPLITMDRVAKAKGALTSDSHVELDKGRNSLKHFMRTPDMSVSERTLFLGSKSRDSVPSAGRLALEGGMSSLQNFSFHDVEVTEDDCDNTGIPSVPHGRQNDSMTAVAVAEQEGQEARDLETLLTTNVSVAGMLQKFVPKCASAAIESNTHQYLGELRRVVTIFIEIVNLEDDFKTGALERPQQVFKRVARPLFRFGGMLRQYVVDDKGCVLIAGFGLPGCNFEDNAVRALETAVLVRRNLHGIGVVCRIGIAEGDVYCGLVGAQNRCEYVMMGTSVNLAARLMGKAGRDEILVSGDVYKSSNKEFSYKALPSVQAKGYVAPVPVFTPISRSNRMGTLLDETDRESTGKLFVGRQKELNKVVEAIYSFANDAVCPQSPMRPQKLDHGPRLRSPVDLSVGGSSGSLDVRSLESGYDRTMSAVGQISQRVKRGSDATTSPSSPSSRPSPRPSPRILGRSLATPDASNETKHLKSRMHIVTGTAGAGKSWFLSEVCSTTQNVEKDLYVCSGFSVFALSSLSAVRDLLQQVFGVSNNMGLMPPMSAPSMVSNHNSAEGSAMRSSEFKIQDENEEKVRQWIADHLRDITIEESFLMASLEKSGGGGSSPSRSLSAKQSSNEDTSSSASMDGHQWTTPRASLRLRASENSRALLLSQQHASFSSVFSGASGENRSAAGGSADELDSKLSPPISVVGSSKISSDSSFNRRSSSEFASEVSGHSPAMGTGTPKIRSRPRLTVVTSSAVSGISKRSGHNRARSDGSVVPADLAVAAEPVVNSDRPLSLQHNNSSMFDETHTSKTKPIPSPNLGHRTLPSSKHAFAHSPKLSKHSSSIDFDIAPCLSVQSQRSGHFRGASNTSIISTLSSMNRTSSFVRRDSSFVVPISKAGGGHVPAEAQRTQSEDGSDAPKAVVDNLCFITDYLVNELLPLLNDVLPVRFPENDVTANLSMERRWDLLEVLIFNILKAAFNKPGVKSLLVIENLQWVDMSSLRILYCLLLEMTVSNPLNCFFLSTLRIHDHETARVAGQSNNTMEFRILLQRFEDMCEKTSLHLFDIEEVRRTLELTLADLPIFRNQETNDESPANSLTDSISRPSLEKSSDRGSLWDHGDDQSAPFESLELSQHSSGSSPNNTGKSRSRPVSSSLQLHRDVVHSDLLSDHVVSEILRRTGGLPFLVSSICSELKQAVETSTYRGIEYLSSDATKIIIWRCDQLTKPQQVALKIASVFGRDFMLGDLRTALQTLEFRDIAASLDTILNDIVNNSALLRWKSIGQSPVASAPLSTLPTTPRSTDRKTFGMTADVDDPMDKLQFEFADQSVVEAVYGLMLGSQRAQVHEIIGDMNEERYFKEVYVNPVSAVRSAEDLQPHQIYDLIVHYRKSDNVEKNVKYLTLAAKSAYSHNHVDSAHLLLRELVKIGSNGRLLSDLMLDAMTERNEVAPVVTTESSSGVGTKEKFRALASLSLTIDTNLASPEKLFKSPSYLSPSFRTPTTGSSRHSAGARTNSVLSPDDHAANSRLTAQHSLMSSSPRHSKSMSDPAVYSRNGPRFSPVMDTNRSPKLKRQLNIRNLPSDLDPYYKTKKWVMISDLKNKYEANSEYICEQAAAENVALLALLTFRIGELQLAHNLCLLFIDKLSLPMVDLCTCNSENLDLETMRKLRANSSDFNAEAVASLVLDSPVKGQAPNFQSGPTMSPIDEGDTNSRSNDGMDDSSSPVSKASNTAKKSKQSLGNLKRFLMFGKKATSELDSFRFSREDLGSSIQSTDSRWKDSTAVEGSPPTPPRPAFVSNIHISALRQLSATNPLLFTTYWKAVDRLILVSLMRGHLAVAEALYSIFAEQKSNLLSGDSVAEKSSTPSSTKYSGNSSGERTMSSISHLTTVTLQGNFDGIQLKATLSTLLLLAGQYHDARKLIDNAMGAVDPTQDQYAWASCLFHRSLHSASTCDFYDARVDLIGASTSFTVVSDSNNSFASLLLRAWCGVLSGDGLHEVDFFLKSMEGKIASDVAIHQKNVFLRRSLDADRFRGSALGDSVETPKTSPMHREPGTSFTFENTTKSSRRHSVESTASTNSNRPSTRMSVKIDDMSVALERLRTTASETAHLSTGDAMDSGTDDGEPVKSPVPTPNKPGKASRFTWSDRKVRQSSDDVAGGVDIPGGGSLPSHLIQWISDLALIRCFMKRDYNGIRNRNAAIKRRRKRDLNTYVANVLLANIACREGRLDEAYRLTMYAVRLGTARDIVHPTAMYVLFLAGLSAVSTMEALCATYPYISLMIEDEDTEIGSDEEENEDIDEQYFQMDSQDVLQVTSRWRHYRQLRRAALVVISTLGKLDFCIFPSYMILRYTLIAKKNRVENNGSLREFLTSFDRILDDTPHQFLMGLAYAYEERELLCRAIGVESEIKPSSTAKRAYPSCLVAKAMFDQLSNMKYSDISDVATDEGYSSTNIINHIVFPWHKDEDEIDHRISGTYPPVEDGPGDSPGQAREMAMRILTRDTDVSASASASALLRDLSTASSVGADVSTGFALYLPMVSSNTYPSLTDKMSIDNIDSLKNIMRPFNIRNPYVFVGCWALKKKGNDSFYKKRFVWIDPFEKLFFWSKAEQLVTPTVDLTAFDASENVPLASPSQKLDNIRFQMFPSGSRIVRNNAYYAGCDLSKTKCVSFADIQKIETSELCIQDLRSDCKPINPAKVASPRRFTPPSPVVRLSGAHSAASSSPSRAGSTNGSSVTLSSSPMSTCSASARDIGADLDANDADEVLMPARRSKKRLSLLSFFGGNSETPTSRAKKADVAGRPPTHPITPTDPMKAAYDEREEYFKFKLKLKDGNEIDLKLSLRIGASEGGIPTAVEIPPETLCNDWIKLAEYCALAQSAQQAKGKRSGR